MLLTASRSKGPAMDREDAFLHYRPINEETIPRGGFDHVADPLVKKALEIIWSPSDYPLSVADIARQLPVTRRTLDRRFAEVKGHSVLEEINTCRLSRARRLLEETELPVKNVARQAGFSSAERMRVLFVERVGMSPTDYRRRASSMLKSSDSAPEVEGKGDDAPHA